MVNWDARFVSENDVDLSVLELLEEEYEYERSGMELKKIRDVLADDNVVDRVEALGRNTQLLIVLRNALINFPDRSPQIPSDVKQEDVQFPLIKVERLVDGAERTFVHLDIPGNPFPIVGSHVGEASINQKVASLGYAMSFCDVVVLKRLLDLAKEYADWNVTHAKVLREEFERLKTELSYVEVEILIGNVGKQPAFLATSADLHLGKVEESARVSLVRSPGKKDDTKWSVVIADWATKLTTLDPPIQQDVRKYQSAASFLTLSPGETKICRFVSSVTVEKEMKEAVQVIRTGHLSCKIVLAQYMPRRIGWLPFLGSYVRRIKRTQRLGST